MICLDWTAGAVTLIWQVLIFIGIFAALIVLHFLIMIVSSFFISKKKTYDYPSAFYKFWLDRTAELVFDVAGVRIRLNGAEKIPAGRRFLFVANHRSNLDPIVCMSKLSEYNIAFISKPEVFKIPVVGQYITRCCFMPIDRENAKNAMKTIHTATERIKNDVVSVAVFPEGTRSKNSELLDFKDGVFYIAKKAKCPLVTAVIKGTELVARRFPFRITNVVIDIVDVLEPEDFAEMSTHEISDRTHGIMEENLQK